MIVHALLEPTRIISGSRLPPTEWCTFECILYLPDWFELFETIRKVLIVGVPSTFNDRGGTAQLFWVSKAQGPNKCPYPLTFILRAFACELQLTM